MRNEANIATEHNYKNYTLPTNERDAAKAVLAKFAEEAKALHAKAEKEIAAIVANITFPKRGERLIVNRKATAKTIEVFPEAPKFFTAVDNRGETLFIHLD